MLQKFDKLVQKTFNILAESETTSSDEYYRYRELEIGKFKERINSLKQEITRVKSALNVAQTAKQRIPLQNRFSQLSNELEVETQLLSQQLSAITTAGREQQIEREKAAPTKWAAIKREAEEREAAIKRETAEREAYRKKQEEKQEEEQKKQEEEEEKQYAQKLRELQRIKQQYYPELSQILDTLNFNERVRYLRREITQLKSTLTTSQLIQRKDIHGCISLLTNTLEDEIWEDQRMREEAAP